MSGNRRVSVRRRAELVLIVVAMIGSFLASCVGSTRLMPLSGLPTALNTTMRPASAGRAVLMEAADVQSSYSRQLFQLQSYGGGCLAMPSTSSGTRAITKTCDQFDQAQWWWYYSDLGLLQSNLGLCLTLWSGSNQEQPYSYACNAVDPRQRWSIPGASSSHITSEEGSCLTVMVGSVNQQPFGWECLADPRQQWAATLLQVQLVLLQSTQGTCMAVNNINSNAYMTSCSATNQKLWWWWWSDINMIVADGGNCLTLYSGYHVAPYTFTCNLADPRQRWDLADATSHLHMLRSPQQGCLNVDSSDFGVQPYSSSCNPDWESQQWYVALFGSAVQAYTAMLSQSLTDVTVEVKDDMQPLTKSSQPGFWSIVAQWNETSVREEPDARSGVYINRATGWRIDLPTGTYSRLTPDPMRPGQQISMRYNLYHVQLGTRPQNGSSNTYAQIEVPVGYMVTARAIRHAFTMSAANGRTERLVVPPGTPYPTGYPTGAGQFRWVLAALVIGGTVLSS